MTGIAAPSSTPHNNNILKSNDERDTKAFIVIILTVVLFMSKTCVPSLRKGK